MSDNQRDSERDGTVSKARRRFLKLAGVTGAVVGSTGTVSADQVLGKLDGDGAAQVEIEDLEGQLPIDDEYLRISVLATAKAAQLQQNYFGEIGEAEEKDPQNLLTNVDTTAEELIIETIREELGDDFEADNHAIYGEETGGNLEGDFDYLWIVDPLDGTTNFVKGIPHFAVNLAVATLEDGELDELHSGVTYYSLRDEVWVAVRDEGAYKFDSDGYDLVAEDSEPTELSVTETETIGDSFNSVGIYLKETADDFDYLGLFRYLVGYSQGTRQLGAAAPDTAFVADGTFDTASMKDLKPVDVAPGVLLVREAGGRVTDFEGSENLGDVLEGSIVATNGELHDDFFDLLNRSGKDWLTRPIDTLGPDSE
ncbi:myo-inositol-1(or 4)-monophosphatase [Halopelagius inordinatus]|uniref:fructose-bisphosphatase n=1 Tax=Halopelagius inordinatus TaxID=553467 RepID=A0A1I2NAS3_9EURY|nr:inositol monophosphatase family protein [Halopelagius inordinatus]SFF98606.1 myo-inositol-1(or 4)-monophosphatase [Halopelagius inordinatus]